MSFRHSRMAARIERKSYGWQSSWKQRLTRQFFSWTIFRAYACEKCGFGWTQCLYSLPKRPNLRNLPEDQNHKRPVYFVQKIFGDLITADHKVLSEGCESQNNHRYAVLVQDLATQWIQAYPCKNKTSQETQRSLQKFLEPERKPKVIYTDNSLEFGKACEDLSWNHCTSTPHRSETSGIVERAVRRVKEGTSAVLLQSGLDGKWWADSMECFSYLRNIQDLLPDEKTQYERRFGEPLKGPIIPFGSLVEYYPISAKEQWRIHQFGKKVLPGLFLGYALYAGGIWKGDIMVADIDELETMDASKIYSKRLNANEVIFPKENENSYSQSQMDDRIRWRRSRTDNIRLDTGTPNSRRKSKIFSWAVRRVSSTISRLISGCWWSDKWFLIHVRKFHIPPSRWTQSQTLLAERRIIPYSTEIHWRIQNYLYKFGCQTGEKRIDDYWNIDGSVDLSDSWTGFTQCTLLDEKLPDGYMWSGRRLTKRQVTSRPDYLWPELWTNLGRNAKLKKKQKWLIEKTKAR